MNSVSSGSQNSAHCNGLATNGTADAVCNSNTMLARKVPNDSGGGIGGGGGGGSPNQLFLKKPAVSLTHLPKRPPVDIEFKNLAYSVSEGRQRGECQPGIVTFTSYYIYIYLM